MSNLAGKGTEALTNRYLVRYDEHKLIYYDDNILDRYDTDNVEP